jgi:hypothetical protein
VVGIIDVRLPAGFTLAALFRDPALVGCVDDMFSIDAMFSSWV